MSGVGRGCGTGEAGAGGKRAWVRRDAAAGLQAALAAGPPARAPAPRPCRQWATVLANVLVLLHMVPAYQVWSQPLFECTEFAVEGAVHRRGKGWPTRGGEVAFRLAFRSAYVICTTFFAVLIPFMGVILGLAGALGFWPATVWAPVECYIKASGVGGRVAGAPLVAAHHNRPFLPQKTSTPSHNPPRCSARARASCGRCVCFPSSARS